MSLVKYVIAVAFCFLLMPAASAWAEEDVGGGAEDEAASVTSASDPNASKIGIGARARYVFMPQAVLNLFLDHSTSMSSFGVGFEIVRRKADFDIVFGVEYDSIAPENGLYLESGDDPGANCQLSGECPDFVEFEGFALLGLDVAFLWHKKLADAVQLRYGAGIGVGLVLGDLFQTDTTCPPGTTADQLDDPNVCPHPAPGAVREKSDDVPPVVPIVNVLFGARFKLAPQLTLNVETGFRDVFFVGVGTDYVF